MKPLKLSAHIAQAINAHTSCVKSNNTEWKSRWSKRIRQMMELLPNGAGFSSSFVEGDRDGFTIAVLYHHMDCMGGYSGYSEHNCTVRGSLAFDFDLEVSLHEDDSLGLAHEDDEDLSPLADDHFRDYLHEMLSEALGREYLCALDPDDHDEVVYIEVPDEKVTYSYDCVISRSVEVEGEGWTDGPHYYFHFSGRSLTQYNEQSPFDAVRRDLEMQGLEFNAMNLRFERVDREFAGVHARYEAGTSADNGTTDIFDVEIWIREERPVGYLLDRGK